MRPPRIPNWNYGKGSVVFLTIVTNGRRRLFGRIENGAMVLSQAGIVADQCIRELPLHAAVELHAHIVMPDHIHALFTILSTPNQYANVRSFGKMIAGTLPAIVRSLKSAVTHLIHSQCPDLAVATIWQRNYYERLIEKKAIEHVRRYILNNPTNWKR